LRTSGLTLDDGHNGTLLNSRGTFETIGVDTAEQLALQVHGVERVGDLIVVGLDLSVGDLLETLVVGSHVCGCCRGDHSNGL
jgi:hypothetical protein